MARQPTIETGRQNAAWVYTIGTFGRNIPIGGRVYRVRADNLRDAIRHLRARHVTRSWTLTLINSERD